jgi:hypothetical protein
MPFNPQSFFATMMIWYAKRPRQARVIQVRTRSPIRSAIPALW